MQGVLAFLWLIGRQKLPFVCFSVALEDHYGYFEFIGRPMSMKSLVAAFLLEATGASKQTQRVTKYSRIWSAEGLGLLRRLDRWDLISNKTSTSELTLRNHRASLSCWGIGLG